MTELVDRIVSAAAHARRSAELLDARNSTAKLAARIGATKEAHDALVAAAHRIQADVSEIERLARRRLADKHEAAARAGIPEQAP